LSTRRTSVQPAGAVIAAVFGRTAIEATMTSDAVVPVGTFTLRLNVPEGAAAEAAARNAIGPTLADAWLLFALVQFWKYAWST